MGSCLSKSGKKGKTDEVDRAPYAPAAKSSPSHSDKQKDLGEVPLRTNVQLEKAPKVYHPGPVTVKGESDHQQPTKQEAVKLSAKQVQPSVSNLPFLSHCIKANFFGHMLMSQLGGSSQDDNLTSDTSNRRVLHVPNAKEQLSLTDRGKHNWERKAL